MANAESNGLVSDDFTWPGKVKVVSPICLVPTPPVSQKRLEIPTWWQWSTYGNWLPGNQMVTWPITLRDPKRSRWWPPLYLMPIISEITGHRHLLKMEHGKWLYLGIKLSRNRWRNVIQKGQGRNPNMLRAHYRKNDWRYRLDCNGVPIGNGSMAIQMVVLDDVASSFSEYWLHIGTPFLETIKLLGHIEKH